MSNKTQLQANNAELQSILNEIQGLPGGVTEGLYVWKKYEYNSESSAVGDFIEYVISNASDTYPNGGAQDGYWYEKLTGLEGLLDFYGCTKIAVSTFTYESRRSSQYSVPHSLGEIPKVVLASCVENSAELSSDYDIKSFSGFNYLVSSTSNTGRGLAMFKNDNNSFAGKDLQCSLQEATFTAGSSSTNITYWGAGIEYTVIAMA